MAAKGAVAGGAVVLAGGGSVLPIVLFKLSADGRLWSI